MNRVRRGKDFKVLWSFFDYNGEPYQLDKTFLTLYVSNSFDRFEVTDFSVEENTITWIFRGKDQKALGDYTLELIQNNGTEGMIPIDSVDAFTLVQYSRDESLCGGGNVKIEDVTVNSTLDIETISSLIDAQLSEISVNPVQNKVITAALNNKADKSSVPTKTSQLTNDSGFITAKEVPAPDWNASTYKEGYIKNRTHHMQDYMCHYFNGSPIKISKPSDVGYVLLTYDTDLPEKFIRIEIKANESKTEEFLDSMGMPLIFTWDAGNSTINVQSFGGAIETYGMRAYYSSSAKGYDEYFVALDEGFIPEKVARKSELKTINGQSILGEGDIEIKGGSSTFVTDFTVNDLYELVYRGAHPVQANIVALQRALENKERIVVPYGTEEYKGYSILQGYYEDLVYFTVADENGSTYVVEVGYDAGEIDRDNVTHVSPKENKINIADLQQKNVQTDAKLTELSSDINDIREHGEIHAYVAGTNDAPTWDIASDRLSRYIKVYKGDRVTIKAATSYGVYCKIVTSVDTSKTPILLQGFFRGQSAEFSVEADGYLMWLLQYNPSQSFAPSELTINGIDCVGGAYKVSKIDGLSKEIAKIDNNVLLLKEEFGESKKIDSVVKGDAGLMLSFKDFSEDGYWTYSNGAVINNGYNYRSYPLLPLTSGQKIKFKGLKSTGSYLAAQIMYLYDNEYRPFNGNYGKILPSQLGLDENGDCEYTLPNNVGYVGFSWTSDYPSEFTIEIEGSWEFTDEAISKIQAACSANSVSEISLGSYYLKGNMEKKAITKKLCIIAGGQSNMNGAIPISEKPSFITLPMNNCHYCYRNNSVTSGGFVPLTEAQLSNWGVDLSLYNQLCNVDGREIYVIKQSLGGVGIDPEGNTGDLCWTADYELIPEAKSFIRGLEKQIRELRENEGENFEIAAFIWHQGEGDYKSPADARYYDNLRKVIAYVRGIVGNPVLPFVFGTISHKSAQYSSVVEAAMNKIAAEDVNTQLIDMSEASLRDAYHFNADWAAYLGKKMYDALIDLKAISGTKLNPTKP